MVLSVFERLMLLGLLPKEGDFSTLKTVRETRELLSFDQDTDEVGLVIKEGRATWEQDVAKEIAIPPKAVAIIVDTLTQLNTEKRLSADHLSLYEKFVGE